MKKNPEEKASPLRETAAGMAVVESHPWEPFLPAVARVLLLGSFPAQPRRWSMDFYYPNFQNDMWRVMGLVFYGDRHHFLADPKHFSPERLAAFLLEKGIAVSDTARRIVRGKGNASDEHLQIVEAIDLGATLACLPVCRAIAATGGKSLETLLPPTGASAPALGGFSEFSHAGRPMRLYRMPSTSRAYPCPLEEKAAAYGKMFSDLDIF